MNGSDGPPPGKKWLVVNGHTNDDLFEAVDEADAKAQFRKLYPGDAILQVGELKDRRQ